MFEAQGSSTDKRDFAGSYLPLCSSRMRRTSACRPETLGLAFRAPDHTGTSPGSTLTGDVPSFSFRRSSCTADQQLTACACSQLVINRLIANRTSLDLTLLRLNVPGRQLNENHVLSMPLLQWTSCSPLMKLPGTFTVNVPSLLKEPRVHLFVDVCVALSLGQCLQ